MVRFEVHEAELARMVRGVGDVAIEGHPTAIHRFLGDVAELKMLVHLRGRVAHHETQVVELVFGVELNQQLCIIQCIVGWRAGEGVVDAGDQLADTPRGHGGEGALHGCDLIRLHAAVDGADDVLLLEHVQVVQQEGFFAIAHFRSLPGDDAIVAGITSLPRTAEAEARAAGAGSTSWLKYNTTGVIEVGGAHFEQLRDV